MFTPPSASSSGSFDGAVLAKLLLLESEADSSTPPRITRFDFEGSPFNHNLNASFSGQFSSYYGLPYDHSPPPEERHQDACSEQSSRGPSTPCAPEQLSPEHPPASSFQDKSTDDPFEGLSTTFLPSTLLSDPRSLLPRHSLLIDTPSYLALKTSPQAYTPLATPSRPTTNDHETIPTPISMPQPTLRAPRPSMSPVPHPTSNRGVTVQQLALDFPLCRSRSSSLTGLIHALENAAPGWYQSLIDSALPQAGSPSLSPASPASSPEQSPGVSPVSECFAGSASMRGGTQEGLPAKMLDDLDELEALALQVRRLPIPRPRTMAIDVVASAFFGPQGNLPPLPTPHPLSGLSSPPWTPLEEMRERRQRQTTVRAVSMTSDDQRSELSDTSYEHVPPMDPAAPLLSPENSFKPAVANIVYHPKLSKTLGLKSLPQVGRLAPAPKTPSWRSRKRTQTQTSRASSLTSTRADGSPRAPFVQNMKGETAPKTPRRASETLAKTPKTLKMLFSRRPSAPPVPLVIQEWDMRGDRRNLDDARRETHLSEPGGRPSEWLANGRGSLAGKNSNLRYSSPDVPIETLSRFQQRESRLGSFLPM